MSVPYHSETRDCFKMIKTYEILYSDFHLLLYSYLLFLKGMWTIALHNVDYWERSFMLKS